MIYQKGRANYPRGTIILLYTIFCNFVILNCKSLIYFQKLILLHFHHTRVYGRRNLPWKDKKSQIIPRSIVGQKLLNFEAYMIRGGSRLISKGARFDQIAVLTLRVRTDRPEPTVNTQIRRCKTRSLIRVYTVCYTPSNSSRKHAYIVLTPLNPTFIQ